MDFVLNFTFWQYFGPILDFPNNRFWYKILPKLSDHDCLIATFEEFKMIFPCQLQSKRVRQMQKRLHDVRFEEPEDKTRTTKVIDISIDIHEQSRHGQVVGPVDDDRSVGGHVPARMMHVHLLGVFSYFF